MPQPGPRCPYCAGNPASVLRDAGDVYGPRWAGKTNLWVCVNYPNCDTYVGVHQNSHDAAPLGTLANKALRKLRNRCHSAFDPWWQGRRMARAKAYRWMAEKLNIPAHRAHIAMLTEDECIALLAALDTSEKKVFSV